MFLFANERTNFFVNHLSINNALINRKRHIRKRETKNKCVSPKFIDEKISSTEHLNILNDYQDEFKFLMLNKKNEESTDNFQTLKDSSTRDTDIVICVESNCPETTEKIDDNENYENKKFKKENNDDNASKVNIINLINLHNSLINKSSANYKKISNVIDIGSNNSKKPSLYNLKNNHDKISL